MNHNKLINEVKSKTEGLDLSNREDIVTYLEARDLLLDNGFINNYNKELQKAYWQLFSDNIYLNEQLKGALKDIQSKDADLRLSASSFLEEEPRKTYSNLKKIWLKDPRTIEILIGALEKEKNEKIIENLILFFGHNASRYGYNDIEIFRKIIQDYESRSSNIKIRIGQVAPNFPTENRWEYLYKSLECKPHKDSVQIVETQVKYHKKDISDSWKEEIINLSIDLFFKVRGNQVKAKLVRIILHLAQKKDLKKLVEISSEDILSSVKKDLTKKIQELS